MKIEILNRLFVVCIFIFISIDAFPQTSINWETPLVPIKISYDYRNGISVTTSAGIKIPFLGKFSIDHTEYLSKKRENSNAVYINKTLVQEQDLIIIIRDQNKNHEQDVCYKIENGSNLEVTTNGKTNIKTQDGMVILDITDVDNCIISLTSVTTGRGSNSQQSYFNNTEKVWSDGAGYKHVFYPNGIYEGYLFSGKKNDVGTYTISGKCKIIVNHSWGTQTTFAFTMRNGRLEAMWEASDRTPNVFTPCN